MGELDFNTDVATDAVAHTPTAEVVVVLAACAALLIVVMGIGMHNPVGE